MFMQCKARVVAHEKRDWNGTTYCNLTLSDGTGVMPVSCAPDIFSKATIFEEYRVVLDVQRRQGKNGAYMSFDVVDLISPSSSSSK